MKKNCLHPGVKEFLVNSVGTRGALASSVFRLLYSDVTTPAPSTSGQQEELVAIAKDPVAMALGSPLSGALLSPELPDGLTRESTD